jgi:hypothetical protein
MGHPATMRWCDEEEARSGGCGADGAVPARGMGASESSGQRVLHSAADVGGVRTVCAVLALGAYGPSVGMDFEGADNSFWAGSMCTP